MEKKMEFEVIAMADDGKEDRTWVTVNVTEDELSKMMGSENWFGCLNEEPKLGSLTARVQKAAVDDAWIPFPDEDDIENITEPTEYEVCFPQEIVDEKRKRAGERRSQYKVKNLRCGYDGGGVGCGPVEGSVLVEAMVTDGDGKLLFVGLSRFTEFAKITLSSVPLFDIMMQMPDWDLNMEHEIEIIEKCTMESWEFENYSFPPELLGADLFGIVKLLLQVERCCKSDERGENFEEAQRFLAKYVDKNGNELMDLDLPDLDINKGQDELIEEDVREQDMIDTLNFGMFTKTLEEVHDSDYQFLPTGGGIFQIAKPSERSRITFTNETMNTSEPPYAVEMLEGIYKRNKGCKILYQERADDIEGIRNAIQKFIEYGWNESSEHKRGRAIWQIKQFKKLHLRYIPEDYEDSDALDKFSMEYLRKQFGVYPLANEVDSI